MNPVRSEKLCNRCKTVKSVHMFYKKTNHGKVGLSGHCKECEKAAKRADYIRNPDVIKARVKIYSENNKEKHDAYQASYRENNREQAKERSAKFRLDNPERVRAIEAASRAKKPLVYRIKSQNRRARERNSEGRISKGLAERLLKLQRGKCACGCRRPLGTDYHLDHIIPLALGGSNADYNIQLLRATCNCSKGAKHPVEFMQQRGFLL